jgi:DUF1680 family protein
MPSVPAYIYSAKRDTVYVNLYLSNEAIIPIENKKITIKQHTTYPWDGNIQLRVIPGEIKKLVIALRIPGWARNDAIPGDLYEFLENEPQKIRLKVNDDELPLKTRNGYQFISMEQADDILVDLHLPMNVRMVRSNQKVAENKGCIAIQRGPLVYCFEEADNGKGVSEIKIVPDVEMTSSMEEDELGQYMSITAWTPEKNAIAIPYYLWSNRGVGEMAVWVKYSEGGK